MRTAYDYPGWIAEAALAATPPASGCPAAACRSPSRRRRLSSPLRTCGAAMSEQGIDCSGARRTCRTGGRPARPAGRRPAGGGGRAIARKGAAGRSRHLRPAGRRARDAHRVLARGRAHPARAGPERTVRTPSSRSRARGVPRAAPRLRPAVSSSWAWVDPRTGDEGTRRRRARRPRCVDDQDLRRERVLALRARPRRAGRRVPPAGSAGVAEYLSAGVAPDARRPRAADARRLGQRGHERADRAARLRRGERRDRAPRPQAHTCCAADDDAGPENLTCALDLARGLARTLDEPRIARALRAGARQPAPLPPPSRGAASPPRPASSRPSSTRWRCSTTALAGSSPPSAPPRLHAPTRSPARGAALWRDA